MLHITLVDGPGAHGLKPLPGPRQLVVQGSAGTGPELAVELDRRFSGPARYTVGGVCLDRLLVGRAPLVSGAVVVRSRTPAPVRDVASIAAQRLTFAVLTGPDAGRLTALSRGRYLVGRCGTDITIDDPDLSREQAAVHITGEQVTITDCGSANGTWVNDRHTTTAAVIGTSSRISFGNSGCALRLGAAEAIPTPTAGDDDLDEPVPVTQQAPPDRGLGMILTATLPFGVGILLALWTGMWIFLAFTSISVVTVLASVIGSRSHRRRFRNAVAAAAALDEARRVRAAPTIADIVLGTLSSAGTGADPAPAASAVRSGKPCCAPTLHVRLGAADQPALLRLEAEPRNFRVPLLRRVPVSMDLCRERELTLAGPVGMVNAGIRSLTVQLGAYPPRSRLLLYLGSADTLPASARFLPRCTLLTHSTGLQAALREDRECVAVVFVLEPGLLDAAADLQLRAGIESGAAAAIRIRPRMAPDAGGSCLRLTGPEAVFVYRGRELTLHPDQVSETTLDRFCRAAGSGAGPAIISASAPACGAVAAEEPSAARYSRSLGPSSLEQLIATGADGILASWRLTRRHEGLGFVIGCAEANLQTLDLLVDGPHVLIAGTTGSGKSELLRTLILSLAMTHPPDRVTVLLVDFKGGSGLAPLAGLPHCVGVLTDLTPEAVFRALISLAAEVTRRERLFARLGAADLSAYQWQRSARMEPLAHLVVVVDEYRMLRERIPEAMDELMRIASVGRSMGIHLILATQRAQGSVSADIRANVTTSIALRVQSGMESTDIIDVPDAAGIPIDQPGRGFIRRGNERPVQFHAASAVRTSREAPVQTALTVAEWDEFLRTAPAPGPVMPDPLTIQAGLSASVSAVHDAWNAVGGRTPRRPIAPALPATVPAPSIPPASGPGSGRHQARDDTQTALLLGLLDLPDRQCQRDLVWRPAGHSHLALFGAGGSGRNSALREVVRQWLQSDGPGTTGLYVFDADHALPGLDRSPAVGAYVSAQDVRRATRVLELLAQLQADRLRAAAPAIDQCAAGEVAADASADLPGGATSPHGGTAANIGLVIAGWERWMAVLRQSPWAFGEEILTDLLRDGGRAGITVLLSGNKDLASSRCMSLIPARIFLPLGASPETLMTWPKLPAMSALPGRALVLGGFAGPAGGVAQLLECSAQSWRETDWASPAPGAALPLDGPAYRPPFRVEPLPRMVHAADLDRGARPVPERTSVVPLLLGIGSDELAPQYLQVHDADVLVLMGAPGSGRSNALRVLAELNPDACPLLIHGHGGDPDQLARLIDQPRTNRPALVLVDDADRLPPAAQQQLGLMHEAGLSLVLAAALNPMVTSKIPLSLQARAEGRGVLLSPRSILDGDFFGVRADIEPEFIPGRALLIEAGHQVPVQIALATGRADG